MDFEGALSCKSSYLFLSSRAVLTEICSKEFPPGATFASAVIEASDFLFPALSWSRELIREFQDPCHLFVSKDGLVAYFSSL